MSVAPVILASQSASRRAMLDAAGLRYASQPAHIDEDAVKLAMQARAEPALAIAQILAEMKALRISDEHPDALVIGSDSVVSVGAKFYDKPVSQADAAQHLAEFSGQTMLLSSAVVVAQGGRRVWHYGAQAKLLVRPLSRPFIADYLATEWPAIAGCVGCFRIEARGVQLFSAIEGDYFTILGMPLLPLLGYLRTRGTLPA